MQITFTTPYDPALSENIAYGYRGGGGKHKYLKTKSKRARETVGWYCKLANNAAGARWQKGKIRVTIMVHRPHMRGDPINFQKLIVDGIKLVIGVDDNQYEGHTQWVLDRDNPHFEITVTQGKERGRWVSRQELG